MSKKAIAIIGASGGIGKALLEQLCQEDGNHIHAFSRKEIANLPVNASWHPIDIKDEESIVRAAASIPADQDLSKVLVTTGLLYDDQMMPEKSIRDLSADKFTNLFQVNAVGPALVAKHFLPIMSADLPAIFAAISARVGSVSDNRKGGWYSYRASKAALNMIIRNLAIEFGRRNEQAIVVGLHPGTVDTNLSKPFKKYVAKDKLFSAKQSASYLLNVLSGLTVEASGKCFDWDGKEVLP